uniref:RT_RNaseH_2 domain-containing protein n=1 Tax=Trichuris muris TaxID=70415 RepID=A0A5S6Q7C4_TRIMR
MPPDTIDAFEKVKKALANAALLSHPAEGAPLSLTVDASDNAAGAVLQQKVNGAWVPLSFFSQRFQPREVKYSAFGRELLAVYLAIRHFRYFLEGRQFTVLTDHKPLVQALQRGSGRHSPREAETTKSRTPSQDFTLICFPSPSIQLRCANYRRLRPETQSYISYEPAQPLG